MPLPESAVKPMAERRSILSIEMRRSTLKALTDRGRAEDRPVSHVALDIIERELGIVPEWARPSGQT